MDDRSIQLLRYIRNEAILISTFVDGIDFCCFIGNEEKKHAVAMALANIGEAERLVSDDIKRKYSDVPWVEIRATRNMIAHAYQAVSFYMIWQTAIESIPELILSLDNIILNESSGIVDR
ncbi:hypothetical protein AGMMS49992_26990 [Clostridia bacterium]|nr:hypothetical protein AGMMS49992_26990 [Clostridia bacterium]